MSASTIFWNGQVISVPGSYSQVDASGLEQVGLGATGIVAVLGTAEGGKPVTKITEIKDLLRFTKPDKLLAAFRDGPLREVGDMLFAPALDPDIQAGAAQVVAMKVNPATQSEATFEGGGADSVTITSVDYGAFTEQINIEIAAGTTQGKLLTIRFEDLVETVDDLGGDAKATLRYDGGSTGFSTITVAVEDDGDIVVAATRAGAGLITDVTTPIVASSTASVVSSNAADTTQTATLYGFAVDGTTAQSETLSLNGTTPVTGALLWGTAGLLGVKLSASCAGTVTVKDAITALTPTVFTVLTTVLTAGIIVCDYCYVNRTSFSVAADAASTAKIVVFGRTQAGAALKEVVTLNGTTPVASVGTTYGFIDIIAVAAVAVARTVTVTVQAAKALGTVQTTLQKAADYFNAKQVTIAGPLTRGFTFDVSSGETAFLTEDLDIKSATTIKEVVASLLADVFTFADWINDNSQLVTCAVVAGASALPDNTGSPVFLSGGAEGAATITQYQTALALLKKIRVNTIVDLSGDPAVAAEVSAHCAYMCGIGRSERDAFVGIETSGVLPTKDEAKAAIVDLNTRHVRAFAQSIDRFDRAGERTTFGPPYLAALAAGMQAGSPVGTSLTFKYMNALAVNQDSSWNPIDDAEELIQAGLCFGEEIEGVGRRIVRNVTTHLSTNNLAYTEGSVNAAVNYATYEFRRALEVAVGKRGFAGTLSATRGVAMTKLDLLVGIPVITTYRSLDLELVADAMEVSVEMAPVIPINFVKSNIHLVTLRQSATAAA